MGQAFKKKGTHQFEKQRQEQKQQQQQRQGRHDKFPRASSNGGSCSGGGSSGRVGPMPLCVSDDVPTVSSWPFSSTSPTSPSTSLFSSSKSPSKSPSPPFSASASSFSASASSPCLNRATSSSRLQSYQIRQTKSATEFDSSVWKLIAPPESYGLPGMGSPRRVGEGGGGGGEGGRAGGGGGGEGGGQVKGGAGRKHRNSHSIEFAAVIKNKDWLHSHGFAAMMKNKDSLHSHGFKDWLHNPESAGHVVAAAAEGAAAMAGAARQQVVAGLTAVAGTVLEKVAGTVAGTVAETVVFLGKRSLMLQALNGGAKEEEEEEEEEEEKAEEEEEEGEEAQKIYLTLSHHSPDPLRALYDHPAASSPPGAVGEGVSWNGMVDSAGDAGGRGGGGGGGAKGGVARKPPSRHRHRHTLRADFASMAKNKDWLHSPESPTQWLAGAANAAAAAEVAVAEAGSGKSSPDASKSPPLPPSHSTLSSTPGSHALYDHPAASPPMGVVRGVSSDVARGGGVGGGAGGVKAGGARKPASRHRHSQSVDFASMAKNRDCGTSSSRWQQKRKCKQQRGNNTCTTIHFSHSLSLSHRRPIPLRAPSEQQTTYCCHHGLSSYPQAAGAASPAGISGAGAGGAAGAGAAADPAVATATIPGIAATAASAAVAAAALSMSSRSFQLPTRAMTM
ncbi:unnamed protein product [Closterium sp. NIES-53]